MKANELDGKDLMTGDYVYGCIETNIVGEATYRILCKVKEINDYGDIVSQCIEPLPDELDGDDFSWIEPVPLTPEILEKNGFEKVYDKYKLPNYRIKWNSYTDLYFTVFTGVDGYWNPIGLNVITGGIPAPVDYVHQLQKALRFCGIEKEIEL